MLLQTVFRDLAPSAAYALLVSLLVCTVLVLTRRWHLRFTGDARLELPQKAHCKGLPRVGGVAIVSGVVAGIVHLAWFRGETGLVPTGTAVAILAALVPVAGCGFAEDLTKRVGPRQRLFWMTVGALCLAGTGWLVLRRTDVPPIDAALTLTPVAVLFTAFALVGASNAFNIVDGLDGLLGGVSLITLGAIAWVASDVGDGTILSIAVLLAAATLAWLTFNWPRAVLFSGDGGAYAIGFVIAVLLVMLAVRHPQVSPWFGLTAAALPVCETIYSIWRRGVSGRSSLQPDHEHLHQLVRERLRGARAWRISRPALAGGGTPTSGASLVEAPNGLVSPLLWLLHGGAVTAGALTFHDTNAQLRLFVAFAFAYVLAYRLLSRAVKKESLAKAG